MKIDVSLKNVKKLNKIYWLYGGIMGLLMIVMEIVHYKTIIRDIKIEVFGIIIGSLFLGLGVWLGLHFVKQKRDSTNFDPDKLGLSKREIEVLELLSSGLSNQEIADSLFVSLNTVKTHISNIYTKLNVQRRTQAIQKAMEIAIIHSSEKVKN